MSVPASHFSVASYWAQGDALGHAVAYLLLAMSLVSWFLILSKAFSLYRVRKAAPVVDAFWAAPSLRDGIALLTRNPEVDIVLMDAMMPDLDGNETTRLIRGLPEGADLPVVFLTAKAMPGDRDKSLAAGASDYITKPVDLDRLLTLMRSWLVDRLDRDGDGG